MECIHIAKWFLELYNSPFGDWHKIYVENIFLYHKFYTIKHLIFIPPKLVIEDIFAALRENAPLLYKSKIEIIFPLISKPQFSGPPLFYRKRGRRGGTMIGSDLKREKQTTKYLKSFPFLLKVEKLPKYSGAGCLDFLKKMFLYNYLS